ncbi:hypothetical protein SO694_00008183 [Aureococcus anophagefferens]|uniref:RING-type domain-containing protein n=1 Tax=Aureococcus anophagefferens TaxID=44056 RepID=A0ABR1GDB5_AURAN
MSDDEPDVAAEWTCAICQDVLLAPVVTPCGHAFDERCLLSWTKDHGTCPVCRSEIPRAGYAVCGALSRRSALRWRRCVAVARRASFRWREDFVTLARSTAPETPRKLRAEALRTPRLVAERRERRARRRHRAARGAATTSRSSSASAPRSARATAPAATRSRAPARRRSSRSSTTATTTPLPAPRRPVVVARRARRHDLAVEALAALLERGAPIPTTAFASRAVLRDVDLTAAFLAGASRGAGRRSRRAPGFYDAREPGRRHGDAVLVTAVQGRERRRRRPARRKLRAILDAAAPLSSDDVNGLHWNQDTERVESALAAAVAADDVPAGADRRTPPPVRLCDIDAEGDDGDTPLLRAAALKRVRAVEALLASHRFANVDKASSGDGSTPLMRRSSATATRTDDGDDDAAEAIVKALLEAGADPNLHRSSDLAYPTAANGHETCAARFSLRCEDASFANQKWRISKKIDESRLSAAELAAARGFGDVVETMVARAPSTRGRARVAAASGQAAVVAKLDVGTRAGWDRPLSPQDAGAWHDPLAAAR